METHLYTCKHCYREFRPARRGVQKFCSNSCRVGHHQRYKRLQQKMHDSLAIGKDTIKEMIESDKKGNKKGIEKKESINIVEIGNAAIGTIVADAAIGLAKKAFTKEGDKPASKADIKELKDLLNKRYFVVHNIRSNQLGHKPFYDRRTGNIVYFNLQGNGFELPVVDLSQ